MKLEKLAEPKLEPRVKQEPREDRMHSSFSFMDDADDDGDSWTSGDNLFWNKKLCQIISMVLR